VKPSRSRIVRVALNSRGLSSAPSEVNPNTTHLSLAGNPITDFSGLATLSALTSLILDQTNLSSFLGAQPQPSLRFISFRETPLAKCPTHRIMAAVVFPDSLTTIHRMELTAEERQKRDIFLPYIANDLTMGWIIQSETPLILCHNQTNRRRIVHLTGVRPQNSRETITQSPSKIERKPAVRPDDETDRVLRAQGSNLQNIDALASGSGFPVDLRRLPRLADTDEDDLTNPADLVRPDDTTVNEEEEEQEEEENDGDERSWRGMDHLGDIKALGSESGFPPFAGRNLRIQKSDEEEDGDDNDDANWRGTERLGDIRVLGSESGFPAVPVRDLRNQGDDEEEDGDDDTKWRGPDNLDDVRVLGSESGFPEVPVRNLRNQKNEEEDDDDTDWRAGGGDLRGIPSLGSESGFPGGFAGAKRAPAKHVKASVQYNWDSDSDE
jgi:hypothetical protein